MERPASTGQQTRQVARASHGLVPFTGLIVAVRSRTQVVHTRAISMVGLDDLSLLDLGVACRSVGFVEALIGLQIQ